MADIDWEKARDDWDRVKFKNFDLDKVRDLLERDPDAVMNIFEKEHLASRDDSGIPSPIKEGKLTYHWVTNACPERVSVDGERVTYDLGGGKTKDYYPAKVGVPTKHDPNGIGIYVS